MQNDRELAKLRPSCHRPDNPLRTTETRQYAITNTDHKPYLTPYSVLQLEFFMFKGNSR